MADGNGAPWETSDLGTAAYLHGVGGLEILGVRRQRSKFVFLFMDPEHRGGQLQVDYINSTCRKFDSAVRSLKKLCYDNPVRQDTPQGARRR